MTKNLPAIVGFDLDGTLVDSGGDIAAALNHALALAGRAPLPVAAVLQLVGGGTARLLRLALEAGGSVTDAEFDRLYAALVDYYDAHVAVLTQPYPGAVEALVALQTGGVRVAVVTNKLEALAAKLLAALDMTRHVDVLIGGDTLGVAKPDPAPIVEMMRRCGGGSAAFVGDSIFDVQAARAAGVPVIAVGFGFSTVPVETLGADAVIQKFADLLPALKDLAQ